MYIACFDQMSASGDNNEVDIICETEGDARQILAYIVAHDTNVHDPEVRKYELPRAETFTSWFEKYGRKL